MCHGVCWYMVHWCLFFFFKQKTAYEMRISDWSSDVCSSDLELQSVAGRRYAIVTGESGRDAMESGLRARGAEVEVIAVYRRVELPHDGQAVARMIDDTDVAIITSGEALARLARLMPAPAQQYLWRLPLVVPSQRVVEQAVRLGFLSTPKVPEQVSDAAYLHCLEQWRAETRSR